MKFTSSALTIVTLSSSSLLFTQGTKVPIGQYELLAAGEPYGEVFTLEPFNAKVYYEAKTGASISTDVYSGVTGESPCDAGSKISSFNTSAISSGPAYDTTTSDGTINSVEITIADVKTSGAYSTTGGNNGKVNMCVRSYLSADYNISSAGNEVVSFVDTHIMLNVDFEAKFQNFTQEINITATASKNFTQNITKDVDVETFLCAPGSNASTSYKIGQDFSVCVRPTAKYVTEGYSVNGFANVTCENTGASRALVKNSVPDVLTTVKSASNVSTYLDSNGTKVGIATAAFGSVVTAGYFSSSESSFTCSGDASLNFTGKPNNNTNPGPPCESSDSLAVLNPTSSVKYGGLMLSRMPICVKNVKNATLNLTGVLTDGDKPYNIRIPQLKVENNSRITPWESYYLMTPISDLCGPDDTMFGHEMARYAEYGFKEISLKFNLGSAYTKKTIDVCFLVSDNNFYGDNSLFDDPVWNLTSTNKSQIIRSFARIHNFTWYCNSPMENVTTSCPTSRNRNLETVKFKDTFGFPRSVRELSSTSASPFATKIGLNSEGTEAITASSAVAYDGLFSIAVFAVSLFFMFSEVME